MHTIADLNFTSKFRPLISAATFTFYLRLNFASSPLERSPKYLTVKFLVSTIGPPRNKERKEHVAVLTTPLALAELSVKMLLKTEGANQNTKFREASC